MWCLCGCTHIIIICFYNIINYVLFCIKHYLNIYPVEWTHCITHDPTLWECFPLRVHDYFLCSNFFWIHSVTTPFSLLNLPTGEYIGKIDKVKLYIILLLYKKSCAPSNYTFFNVYFITTGQDNISTNVEGSCNSQFTWIK